MTEARDKLMTEIEHAMKTLRVHRKLLGFTLPLRRRALFTEAIEHVGKTKPEICAAYELERQSMGPVFKPVRFEDVWGIEAGSLAPRLPKQ